MVKIQRYDVVIIGGGPAGMSAALWCSDVGLRSVLLESRADLGGQLSIIHNPIVNYLGVRADNGDKLARRFVRSLDGARFHTLQGNSVVTANLSDRRVETDDGSTFEGRSVIIATGVRRRKLGVEGEEEFLGRGLLSSGAKEREKVKGKNVVVVGGGDAAIENALILSEIANSVTVVHRRNELRARGQFTNRFRDLDNVTLLTGRVVERFEGEHLLRRAIVRDLQDDSVISMPCDFGLIRIGVQPNVELFNSQVDVDGDGYIKIDSNCQTSLDDIYAVGDIANPNSMTIATAVGNSATAVSHLLKKKNN